MAESTQRISRLKMMLANDRALPQFVDFAGDLAAELVGDGQMIALAMPPAGRESSVILARAAGAAWISYQRAVLGR